MSDPEGERPDFFDAFYKAFEDTFRGSRELIKERHRLYTPFLSATLELQSPRRAVDLGCGRGEWLELLKETGFEELGIDLNEAMLADCRKRGLNVRRQDALAALRSLPENSQSIVSGFHIAEHLEFGDLLSLLEQSVRALAPGGLLILETPNPDNIRVATGSFYLDPTHRHPLPWHLLAFAAEYCGFARTKMLGFREDPEAAQDRTRLASLLDGVSRDYALVAQKRADGHIMSRADHAFQAQHGVTFDQLAVRQAQQDRARETTRSEEIEKLQRSLDAVRADLEVRATDLANATAALTETMASLRADVVALQGNEARLLTEAMQREREYGTHLAHLASQLQEAAAANADFQQQIDQFRNSTSWRLTAPLRWIVRLLRLRA